MNPPVGEHEAGRRARSGCVRTLGCVLGVAAIALPLLLVLGAWFLSSDFDCEVTPGDSNFGTAEWTWLPVGTACRWTEELNGVDRLEAPGWLLTVVVAVTGLVGIVLLLASLPRRSLDALNTDTRPRDR